MLKKILALLLCFQMVVTPAMAATYTLTATDDTRLNPSATTTNYGSNTTVDSAGENSAALFRFDWSALGINPLDIVSADLRIWGSRGFQHTINVNRSLRNWVEAQATWVNFSTGNAWGTAGSLSSSSDYSLTNQVQIAAPGDDWAVADVTDLVVDMMNSANHGFLLRGSASSMYVSWRSSEFADASFRPTLIIRTGTPGIPTHYYLRTDGGTCGLISPQCTGLVDASYASVGGAGTNQACACNHPKYLSGDDAGTAQFMLGEDVVHIRAGDTFTISSPLSYFPSGSTISARTKILGNGYDTTCPNPPKFSGDGVIHGLRVGSNTEIACLDIIDTNGCIQTINAGGLIDNAAGQDPIKCGTGNTPVAGSMNTGIKLATGAVNVSLKYMNVNGPSFKGMEAHTIGRLDMDHFHINGAGYVGIDGDPGGCPEAGAACNWAGPVSFTNSSVKYSGCGWRTKATSGGASAGTPHNCWSQDQTGYGDAFGVDGSAGAWTIDHSEMSFNVSDGWDFLYSPSTLTTVNHSRGEGNAGAVFKSGNPNVIINNSTFIGNCSNWAASPWPFGSPTAPGRTGGCNTNGICDATENWNSCGDCAHFNVCRPSNHSVLSLTCGDGIAPQVYNTTVTGNADAIIFVDARTGCSPAQIMTMRNIVVGGATEYNGGESDTADFYYCEPNGVAPGVCPSVVKANIVTCGTKKWNTEDCVGATNSTCVATCANVFVGPLDDYTPGYYTGSNYIAAHYLATSSNPARDTADESVTMLTNSNDMNNFSRGASWDIGGIEFGSTPPSCLADGQTCSVAGDCCGGNCCSNVCASSTCPSAQVNWLPYTLSF